MSFRLEAARFENTLRINVVLDQPVPGSNDTTFSTFIRFQSFTNPPTQGLVLEFNGIFDEQAVTFENRPLIIDSLFATDVDGAVISGSQPGDVLFYYDFTVLQQGFLDVDTFDVGLNGASRTDTFEGAIGPRIFTDANFVSFFPTSGPDSIVGTDGNDTLDAGQGNDTLEGAGGNDQIDGGEGADTATYSGPQSSHTVTISPSGTTVEDRRADGNGTDSLTGVEFIEFNGSVLDLNAFGGAALITIEELEDIIELYIAYFNRAPDALGLNFWATNYANGQVATLDDMARLFAPQEETLMTYPEGTSDNAFVTAIYNNVLGRDPDAEGFAFWTDVLGSGVRGRDEFILAILRGVDAPPAPGDSAETIAQRAIDREYLDTKTDIGAYFAVHLGMSDVDNARAVMDLYDGFAVTEIDARNEADNFLASAVAPEGGEFLMPLVGVLTDDFDPSSLL